MDANRAQQAVDFIGSCCPNVGAFSGDFGAVSQYLKNTAKDMAAADTCDVFPERYIEHVAYAVDMVASSFFTWPPAAVASVYLATRFEFYFRILSGKLTADGKWISAAEQAVAQAAIADARLARRGVSSVALTYKVMMLDQSRQVVQHCTKLDSALYPTPISATGPTTIASIGDRIEFGRNGVGHGHWGDISSEAHFYGLLTALVFYSESKTKHPDNA